MANVEWQIGMKLVHRAQPGWGVGAVTALGEDGLYVRVLFAGRPEGPVVLSTRDEALARYRFAPGAHVRIGMARAPGVVLEERGTRAGFYAYDVETDDGEQRFDERELFAPPPEPGPLAALKNGQWDPPEHFALRQEAVTLDLQRRGDALGGLFASRVMVKPYQVSVVQRVLSARAPRFVLADEVGLGKTIEAGMILSALAQTGIGRRLLVVAPSHLTLQWLAELYRKFNLRFSLLDGERLETERKKDPTTSPFLRADRILTSLELLARSDDVVELLSSKEGAPDLVVFDEAHHLAGTKAFAAAEKIARASWGVLFLTATPLALDQEEYFHLLQLLEPSAAKDPKDFRARLARSGEVAALSRAILAGASEATALADALAAKFPGDARLQKLVDAWKKGARAPDRERLLEHLADGYTLSTRLLRNRRAAVGGFPKRLLVRHEVKLSDAERELLTEARKLVRAGQQAGEVPTGAVGGALLRRIESSPAAAGAALTSVRYAPLAKLEKKARALEGPEKDARYRAFRELLRELGDEKVLVFSESRETLSMLAAQLERDGIIAAQYHGDLAPLERDRQVARFRDPDGPRLLLSSELGGEGRNFQFCRHLIHYDLPYSPSMVEQRIGRIDRVGQRRDMSIHVLEAEGTVGSRVVKLLSDAVGVFTQPVGGLDPVLDGVEEAVARLAIEGGDADWDAYHEELSARVELARAEIRENYDPLLDRRSFDLEAVARLLVRGAQRLNVAEDLPESLAERESGDAVDPGELEEGLQVLSRELEERLEDVTLRLARQAGIGVDTDEQVEAFECALTLGREMKIEALPGVPIPDDPETLLGSFWRDTAIEREEIEYFGSGHRLVEALVSLARDGQVGRSTFRKLPARERALGFQFRYLWQLPEAEDVAGGTRVPSRAASRLLPRMALDVAVTVPDRGEAQVRPELVERLVDPEADAEPLRREAVPLDKIVQPLEVATQLAAEAARRALAEDVAQAKARLDQDREAAAARLELRFARADDAEREGLEREEDEERAFFDAIGEALEAVRIELDAAAGFLLG